MEEEVAKAVEQVLSLLPILVFLVILMSIFIVASNIRGKGKEEEEGEGEESTKDEVGTMEDEIRQLQKKKRSHIIFQSKEG